MSDQPTGEWTADKIYSYGVSDADFGVRLAKDINAALAAERPKLTGEWKKVDVGRLDDEGNMIQRWEYFRDFSGNVVSEQGIRKSPVGQFVSWKDHNAALAAAYRKGKQDVLNDQTLP